jgi:RNA polymerase sigma factor (sigma-70 family)
MDEVTAHGASHATGGHEATARDQAEATSSSARNPAPEARPTTPDSQPGTRMAAPEGYEVFYREFMARLVAFVVYHGASLNEAADIAQETMIDAYRSWPSIEYPQAWAKRVASRKYGRLITQVEPRAEGMAVSPLLPAEFDVHEWEERHEVLRILAKLPLRQRQVMAWTYDGYTSAEIAVELSITVEAVRANLARARRALAELLGSGERGNRD